jgi:hypothetical protein
MTTIKITLDDTITIPLGRNSVYGTLNIVVGQLPDNALEYIWSYGLKQVLNDAMATKVDKDGNALSNEEIAAKALAKRDALYEGTIRMRGEAVAADAYEAEAIREAKRHVIAVFSKNGLMKDIPKGTDNRMIYALNRHLASQGKPETTEADYLAIFFETKTGKAIRERAIKTVDERRTLAADMDDLI